MKKVISLLLLLLGLIMAKAQVVPSSCTAPDTVVKLYSYDADRLTIRRDIYRYGNNWKDSVKINPIIRDTLLKAMLAVYNSTSLPARDTVVDIAKIHVKPALVLDEMFLALADTNAPWVKNLIKGNFITGNTLVDSLLALGNFNRLNVISPSTAPTGVSIMLYAAFNQNLAPIIAKFYTLPEIHYASSNHFFGADGVNITDSIYAEYIELTYSYGWVDCYVSCWYRHYWKFKVHPGCDVEYVGSYGDPVPADLGLRKEEVAPIMVWPNPFSSHIRVSGAARQSDYTIYNAIGQPVQSGTLGDNGIEVQRKLPPGPYLLQLKPEGQTMRSYHLIKE